MCKIPDKMKFSFSSLSTFDQCPMAWKLKYIDHVHDDDNAYGQYGTFAHKILEQWAKGELPEFLMAAMWEDGYDSAVTLPFPPFPKGYGQKVYDQGLAYFQNFHGFGDCYEVLSAEERFEINVGGEIMVGMADLVLRNRENGGIVVVDHKSKSMTAMKKDMETYKKQLYVYAQYVYERFGEYPCLMMFNMFKEDKLIVVEFNEEELAATMQWISETIQRIRDEKEWRVSCSSYFCRYICGVIDSCEAKDAILYGDMEKKND